MVCQWTCFAFLASGAVLRLRQLERCIQTLPSPTSLSSPRRPGLIGKMLDLKRGGNNRYQKTAAYGHFGRSDPDFTWEKVVPLPK